MAKKKDELTYLQMPLSEGRKYYKMTRVKWTGLNRRQVTDTGALSMERNISAEETPYLVPSQKRIYYHGGYSNPIGMFGFDNFLVVIYRVSKSLYIDYITADGHIYKGVLQNGGADEEDDKIQRCIIQFNKYDIPTDPTYGEINTGENTDNGGYTRKLIIFPDKKVMDFKITESDFEAEELTVTIKVYYNDTPVSEEDDRYPPPDNYSHNYFYKNTFNEEIYRWVDDDSDSDNSGWKVCMPPVCPPIKYAVTHLSRVFGVSDTRVYASGFNDYSNWNTDTADEYNESNSWCSPSQSNSKADGNFTGIAVFQSHVICFKRDFMHEIYNTKNPFRIQDIFNEGAVDQRTIQDVDGRLIFVSDDDVKIYTGSNPSIIGYYLNIKEYRNPVSGTDGRRYYLYCEDENDSKHLFVYDTLTEQWSEEEILSRVINFAHTKTGMYMLTDKGDVFKTDTGDYSHSWAFETDLITNQSVSIKHIRKIQMFAYLDNADINVYILYDDEEFDENTSHLVYSGTGSGQRAIRVRPRQTAGYGIKLHIEGRGYVRLHQAEIFMEDGGDKYVTD